MVHLFPHRSICRPIKFYSMEVGPFSTSPFYFLSFLLILFPLLLPFSSSSFSFPPPSSVHITRPSDPSSSVYSSSHYSYVPPPFLCFTPPTTPISPRPYSILLHPFPPPLPTLPPPLLPALPPPLPTSPSFSCHCLYLYQRSCISS